MQEEQSKLTLEQLQDTVQAYCCKENRWFGSDELEPLLLELVATYRGSHLPPLEKLLAKGKQAVTYGHFVEVILLPFHQALEGYPEISKEIARKYGHVIVVSGNGYPGAELYFVDRNARALSRALDGFKELLNLKKV